MKINDNVMVVDECPLFHKRIGKLVSLSNEHSDYNHGVLFEGSTEPYWFKEYELRKVNGTGYLHQ